MELNPKSKIDVRIELNTESKPGIRVFSMDGEDLTMHATAITLHCDGTATLKILNHDAEGNHYLAAGRDFLAFRLARVLSIKGEWESWEVE